MNWDRQNFIPIVRIAFFVVSIHDLFSVSSYFLPGSSIALFIVNKLAFQGVSSLYLSRTPDHRSHFIRWPSNGPKFTVLAHNKSIVLPEDIENAQYRGGGIGRESTALLLVPQRSDRKISSQGRQT